MAAFGFKFMPTDEEVIKLLVRKSMDLPTLDGPVVEKNLYGDQHPSEVMRDIIDHPYWMTTKDSKDMYVFTKLTKVSSRKSCSTRIQRTVNGHGTWGGQTGAKGIKDSTTGELIGSKKMFSFVDDDKNGIHDHEYHWIMHEFSLDGNSLKYDLKHLDYVMCKITRRTLLSKKKRILDQEDPEERLKSKKQKTTSTKDQETNYYNDEVVQMDSTKDGNNNDLNGVIQLSNDEFWASFEEFMNRPDYGDDDAIFNNNTNNSLKSGPIISVQQSDDDDDELYEFSATLEQDLLLL